MSSYDERESPEKTPIVEEEEEESVGDGQPQPPTELFKGQDFPRSGSSGLYLYGKILDERANFTMLRDHCFLKTPCIEDFFVCDQNE